MNKLGGARCITGHDGVTVERGINGARGAFLRALSALCPRFVRAMSALCPRFGGYTRPRRLRGMPRKQRC